MGKTFWYIELSSIFSAQLQAKPFAEAGTRAEIDSNIPHGSLDHSHQLALSKGRVLKMQPTKYSPGTGAVVILNERAGDSVGCVLGLFVRLEKASPTVTEYSGLDDN